MIRFFTSNSVEIAERKLVERIAEDERDIFVPHCVLVQNRGFADHLRESLTESLGVLFNVRFFYPDSFSEALFDCVEKGRDEKIDAVSDERITHSQARTKWMLFELFESENETARQALGHFNVGKDSATRLKLAGIVADWFDRYSTHRADRLEAFLENDPSLVQKRLLEALRKRFGWTCFADRLQRLIRHHFALQRDTAFPSKISVFWMNSLAPHHLSVLKLYSLHKNLDWYHHSPSADFWTESFRENWPETPCSSSAFSFDEAKEPNGKDFPPESFGASGNGLLGLHGKAPAACFKAMMELGIAEDYGEEGFDDRFGDTLLGRMQRKVLENVEPQRGDYPAEDDGSIRFSVSPSVFREVETLYNFIGFFLERHPEASPADVLVVLPRFEEYENIVRAVFGNYRPNMPYAIADTSSPPWDGCLMKILQTLGGRFDVDGVFALLEEPPIARKFGVETTLLPVLKRTAAHAGIRWGIDAEHRRKLGAPALEEFSWEWGLERLLLGQAMSERHDELFGNVSPVDLPLEIAAEDWERFLDFFSTLRSFAEDTENSRKASRWMEWLEKVEAAFLPEGWRSGKPEAVPFAEKAGFEALLDYSLFLRWTEDLVLTRPRHGSFSPVRGVRFSDPLYSRGRKFKLIAVVGITDETFPRKRTQTQGDLLREHPQPTDPDAKTEDRWLFLQYLLNAETSLLLSYVSESSPPVAFSDMPTLMVELERHLCQGFSRPEAGKRLFFRQSVHAFSEENDDPENPFANYATHLRSRNGRSEKKRADGRTTENEEPGIFSLEDVKRCFREPSAYFLRRNFGIRFKLSAETARDEEPFVLKGLELYLAKNHWKDFLRRKSAEERVALWKARGVLPAYGLPEKERLELEDSLERYRRFLESSRFKPEVPFALKLEPGLLYGTLDHLNEAGNRLAVFSNVRADLLLSAWLEHLVVCILESENRPTTELLIKNEKKDSLFRWQFVPQADRQLTGILRLYLDNLRNPLPFFPKTAMRHLVSKSGFEDSPERVLAEIKASETEELRLPANVVCFGEDYVPDLAFVSVCRELLEPLLDKRFFSERPFIPPSRNSP